MPTDMLWRRACVPVRVTIVKTGVPDALGELIAKCDGGRSVIWISAFGARAFLLLKERFPNVESFKRASKRALVIGRGTFIVLASETSIGVIDNRLLVSSIDVLHRLRVQETH